MRPDRVVAGIALVAVLALVAVPGTVGHQASAPVVPPQAFAPVAIERAFGTAPTFDPANDSASVVDALDVLTEPPDAAVGRTRPDIPAVAAAGGSLARALPAVWRRSGSSWYGPGLYGHGTACGQTLTTSLVGVAHRTLPCGTLVAFRNPATGRVVLARVVDRGPYVSGRDWDLTAGLCRLLDHCYTAPIDWRLP